MRNIINKRDDDIFELKPKTPEELEALAKEKEEWEQKKKEEENKGIKGAKKEVKEPPKPQDQNPAEEINYLIVYDPYNATHEIKFNSPLGLSNEKLIRKRRRKKMLQR